MDLQQKIQQRRIERELEEKKLREQENMAQDDQRRLEVERAKNFLKNHPDAPEESKNLPLAASEDTDHHLTEDQSGTDAQSHAEAENLDESANEEARKNAEQVIHDEAVNRVGGFSRFVTLALLGIGIYDLFASGWFGLVWIVAGVAYWGVIFDRERKKLLDHSD